MTAGYQPEVHTLQERKIQRHPDLDDLKFIFHILCLTLLPIPTPPLKGSDYLGVGRAGLRNPTEKRYITLRSAMKSFALECGQ